MGVFEFFYKTILVLAMLIASMGVLVTLTDVNKLKVENKKLKEDLYKARKRKIKREYKKVRIEREDK